MTAVGQTTSAAVTAGGGTETITGRDVNPGETASIFNALNASARPFARRSTERAVGLIDSSTQVNFTS